MTAPPCPPPPPLPAADYRRAARRLRARFGGDADRLQHSLAKLAQRQDAVARRVASIHPSVTRRTTEWVGRSDGRRVSVVTEPSAAGQFAAAVGACLEGEILPYAARRRLLRAAGRLGIDRFDANLIIARAQHRHAARVVTPVADARQGLGWVTCAVFVVTEMACAAAGWWFVHPWR